MIVKKGSRIVEILINDSAIEIKENNKTIYSAKYSDIINYNVYNFINKRGGYVVRLKDKKRSFCSLLTWNNFSKANEIDYQCKDEIINNLQINLRDKKKTTFTDYAVKTVFCFTLYYDYSRSINAYRNLCLFIKYLKISSDKYESKKNERFVVKEKKSVK